MKTKTQSLRDFLQTHYKHFNAAAVLDAAEGWCRHLEKGGKMLLAMGGAMSTAEIGISLAAMIREDKVHGISTTGANLEEDLFNLVAHRHYKRIPSYRSLTAEEELELRERGLNRVTDTCIPEEEAMRKIGTRLLDVWRQAEEAQKRFFPYEFIYQLFDHGLLKEGCEGNSEDSWVFAAYQKGIPIFTPGWEDSTMGNGFVAHVLQGRLRSLHTVKNGLEQMAFLTDWYLKTARETPLGFFQIGGGIAGDFAICVVPLVIQDMKQDDCPRWAYFAQISDSTTSYGSYSGAVPNEKITWGKLDLQTPRFMIESDATIVAPLIFQYILESP